MQAEVKHVLAEASRAILWNALNFTRRVYRQSKQVGALTLAHRCDHCQCFPHSDCTWFLFTGVSKRVKDKGSHSFCGRCGHIYNKRQRSRILSIRCGPEPHDEVFLCLASNASDNDRPFSEEDRSRKGVETSQGVIKGIKEFIVRDSCADVNGRSME